jgi:hypothetical protein
MLLDLQKFKPVQTGGMVLITMGAVGFFLYFQYLSNHDLMWFILIVVAWHVVTGIGIILRTVWGFYLLKSYLYVLLLGFPVGTYIGWKSLVYLRDNEIKNFFGRKALEL